MNRLLRDFLRNLCQASTFVAVTAGFFGAAGYAALYLHPIAFLAVIAIALATAWTWLEH